MYYASQCLKHGNGNHDHRQVRNFQPINLLNSFYKLLAKVIACRMEAIMNYIVSPSQCAFVRGRQMLDCSLVANEWIDHWARTKREGIICHIEMEKGYDHVNWSFLDWVLDQMGFGSKWRFWIRIHLNSGSYSLLVNGTSTGINRGQWGIQQGDPISPFCSTSLWRSSALW